MKEGASPSPSPLLNHRTPSNVRAVTRTADVVDSSGKRSPPSSPQPRKVRNSPDSARPPATVVRATSPTSPLKQLRGAYVNIQTTEGKTVRERPESAKNGSLLSGRPKSQARPRNLATPRKRAPIAETPLSRANRKMSRANVCPQTLLPSGNTPKLARRVFANECEQIRNKENQGLTSSKDVEDAQEANKDSDSNCVEKLSRFERKIKRSESYRMANSPIMFMKRFSASAEKTPRIVRTPSEEIQEELLRERINYPETVSSPEPPMDSMEKGVDFETDVGDVLLLVPTSPRPRALDLEPAKVLKYSSNDTEIW